MRSNVIEIKPRRPRTIAEELTPGIFYLYKHGFGYRATACELRNKGISVNWSTVRRIVKNKCTLTYCSNKTVIHPSVKYKLTVDHCRGLE